MTVKKYQHIETKVVVTEQEREEYIQNYIDSNFDDDLNYYLDDCCGYDMATIIQMPEKDRKNLLENFKMILREHGEDDFDFDHEEIFVEE